MERGGDVRGPLLRMCTGEVAHDVCSFHRRSAVMRPSHATASQSNNQNAPPSPPALSRPHKRDSTLNESFRRCPFLPFAPVPRCIATRRPFAPPHALTCGGVVRVGGAVVESRMRPRRGRLLASAATAECLPCSRERTASWDVRPRGAAAASGLLRVARRDAAAARAFAAVSAASPAASARGRLRGSRPR